MDPASPTGTSQDDPLDERGERFGGLDGGRARMVTTAEAMRRACGSSP